jgi:hypothetical protein
MRTYLITYKGRGRKIDLEPSETSAADYERLQREFAQEAGARGREEYATMWNLDPRFATPNGVMFEEWLSGADGMSFLLFQMPDTTDETIKEAKDYLRQARDVVLIRVLKIREMLEEV